MSDAPKNPCAHVPLLSAGAGQIAREVTPCLRCEIEQLRAALKVARQAILEFSHAQECGPKWYTRGEDGMYRQVHMWLRKGLNAVREALGPYDDNGQFLKEIPEKGASESNAL